jgi:hypothetical protein
VHAQNQNRHGRLRRLHAFYKLQPIHPAWKRYIQDHGVGSVQSKTLHGTQSIAAFRYNLKLGIPAQKRA